MIYKLYGDNTIEVVLSKTERDTNVAQ